MFITIVVFIIQAIIFGILTSKLAQAKGYREAAGFAVGFFLSIVGMLFYIGMPMLPDNLSEDDDVEYYDDYDEYDNKPKKKKSSHN